MAKNNFLSWDTAANNNTDIGGVNIAEGCAPSGINNAIRTIMAQLRADIDGGMVYAAKSTNYTAVLNDNNAYLRFTAAATLTLDPVATLGADWHVFVQADGGDVIVDPNLSETINGTTTITIRNGESALIISNGSAFFARINPINTVTYAEKSGNYTAVAADNRGTLRFTAAATLALTAAATLGSAWRTTVINSSSGLITIDPNASETVNGAATAIIGSGQTATIVCSGTAFFADIHSDPLSGPQLQGYVTGLALTTNAGDATNDVDIAVGAAASDVSPYYLMQLTSALTKRIDANWAVGTNQGGLDTGAVGNNTYYIWLIQRSDTLVTDVLFSLSSTAPTMPANYDRKRLLGLLVRASATNGAPYLNAKAIGNTGPILIAKGAIPTTATVDWTIPAGVRRIRLVLSAFSTNGTSQPLIQLKTGGSAETSGYVGGFFTYTTATGSGNHSSGFANVVSSTASFVYYSDVELSSNDGTTWFCGINTSFSNVAGAGIATGTKTLAGLLDGIRLTTAGGTDVPDAGTYSLYVEY